MSGASSQYRLLDDNDGEDPHEFPRKSSSPGKHLWILLFLLIVSVLANAGLILEKAERTERCLKPRSRYGANSTISLVFINSIDFSISS